MSNPYYPPGGPPGPPGPPYPQQQPHYGYPPQQSAPGYPPYQPTGQEGEKFGPPRRQDSFGPPAAGGFQHGYEGGHFGAYDASNPQGPFNGPPADNRGFSHSPSPQPPPYDQVAGGQQPPFDPNNPNAPAEGERGLGSSLLGGAAGYYVGHKQHHGLLGAVGGAIVGNIVGNKVKERRHHNQDPGLNYGPPPGAWGYGGSQDGWGRHGRHGHHGHHHGHHRGHHHGHHGSQYGGSWDGSSGGGRW